MSKTSIDREECQSAICAVYAQNGVALGFGSAHAFLERLRKYLEVESFRSALRYALREQAKSYKADYVRAYASLAGFYFGPHGAAVQHSKRRRA